MDALSRKRGPAFGVGDKVWYIDNATMEARSGVVSAVAREENGDRPVSYIIDNDDGIHSAGRYEPFLFSSEHECSLFRAKYKKAIDELLYLFLSRMYITDNIDMSQARVYLSDLSATLYGRIEEMKGKGEVIKFLDSHINDGIYIDSRMMDIIQMINKERRENKS